MASFIFTEKHLDDEFFKLDAMIEEAAIATPGFLGKESWIAADQSKRNSVYYWTDKDALDQFARHPLHLKAKRQYEKWYGGFHVVISQVTKSYGDSQFDHVTPNSRPGRHR
ncbi:antibiotic biosynthesis monooxygenase family protein [Pseudaestuariivita rosea]|uniref:antibiotic biosynthesis monooxygenase family protein n=1 Tax=Pseudaestuariivita rosea TaxID=2763263 RepID=UPI001F425154|nr:DUF4188 domain-containing protein [Pseudaestuariivita rosea]